MRKESFFKKEKVNLKFLIQVLIQVQAYEGMTMFSKLVATSTSRWFLSEMSKKLVSEGWIRS